MIQVDLQVTATYQAHFRELARNDGGVRGTAPTAGENALGTQDSTDVGGIDFATYQHDRGILSSDAFGCIRIESDGSRC